MSMIAQISQSHPRNKHSSNQSSGMLVFKEQKQQTHIKPVLWNQHRANQRKRPTTNLLSVFSTVTQSHNAYCYCLWANTHNQKWAIQDSGLVRRRKSHFGEMDTFKLNVGCSRLHQCLCFSKEKTGELHCDNDADWMFYCLAHACLLIDKIFDLPNSQDLSSWFCFNQLMLSHLDLRMLWWCDWKVGREISRLCVFGCFLLFWQSVTLKCETWTSFQAAV